MMVGGGDRLTVLLLVLSRTESKGPVPSEWNPGIPVSDLTE